MSKAKGGNGKPHQIQVTVREATKYHAIFTPHPVDSPDEDVPLALSDALEKWTEQKGPELLIHAVCPIVKDGRTVKVHVWFG